MCSWGKKRKTEKGKQREMKNLWNVFSLRIFKKTCCIDCSKSKAYIESESECLCLCCVFYVCCRLPLSQPFWKMRFFPRSRVRLTSIKRNSLAGAPGLQFDVMWKREKNGASKSQSYSKCVAEKSFQFE